MGEINKYEGCISVGTWGGSGGKEWSYKPKGSITQIVIAHGGVIDSLTFKTKNSNGVFEYSKKFGGRGGNRTDKVDIDSPTEYLTGISGTYGNYGSMVVLRSIRFQTNVARYGPFGSKEGNTFSSPIKGGVIIGFHGLADMYLNAIGFYVESRCPLLVSPTSTEEHINSQVVNEVMKLVVPRCPGPWGGTGGKHWDDGVFSGIKQIHVHVGNTVNVIHAIQFEYEKRDGNFVWSPMHGGTGGDIVNRIKLNGPKEFLVGIEGFYGPVEGNNWFEAIRCICFYTNRGKYGPFGSEMGTYFTSASTGKVVGFHGQHGTYLSAIGVHMEYI